MREREAHLPILFSRESFQGKSIHLHKFDGTAVYVGYDGELRWLQILTERVRDGTYNQPVNKIPYIVIEDDVYPLDSFTEVAFAEVEYE